MVSVVASYHSEGQAFAEEFISQLRASLHIEPYEIIVVDDCSPVPLKPIEGVTVLRQPIGRGVGQAFDLGISHAKYENIFFLACDIRFIDNGWDSILLNEVKEHPQSVVCTTCIGINSECMDLVARKDHKYGGATILIFHDHLSNPRKKPNFRGLFAAKWLPYQGGEGREIPCILGACYGTTKSWYQHIDGFWGHRLWGSLEPYISLKSWMFGGSCRIVPQAEIGHIFKTQGTHGTPQDAVVYNQMLIAKLLFSDSDRLIKFLGGGKDNYRAEKLIRQNMPLIESKAQDYAKKVVMPVDELVIKLGLDYRK